MDASFALSSTLAPSSIETSSFIVGVMSRLLLIGNAHAKRAFLTISFSADVPDLNKIKNPLTDGLHPSELL
jgi:hypothetical protein